LVLTYYLSLAIILAIISGTILLLVRRKEKVKNVVVKVFHLPISYILAHICIKGLNTSSYSAARDFYAILFVTVLLYIALMFATSIVKEYKKANMTTL